MTYTPHSYHHYIIIQKFIERGCDNWEDLILNENEVELLKSKGLLKMLCKYE